jgi:hypothetical protein
LISDNLELFADSQFSDNQINKSAFVGRLIIYVDPTPKISNLLEDIKKVERFVQSVGHARYSDAYSDIKGSKKTGISSKKN